MFRNLLSVVGVMALVLGLAGIATAGPVGSIYDPGDYTALGSLSYNSGTLTFDTDTGTVTHSGDGLLSPGLINQANQSGNVWMAVFTYSSINLGAGVTISVTGNQGIVLASQGDLTFGSTIDIAGDPGSASSAGAGGPGAEGAARAAPTDSDPPGSTAGDGGAPGNNDGRGRGAGGGASRNDNARGGTAGYGGTGEVGIGSIGAAGLAYGDNLLEDLYGGSGGGGGTNGTRSAAGGGGGGSVALIALGNLTLDGTIEAYGGAGGLNLTSSPSDNAAGGGGSGGGVLLAGGTVAFGEDATVNAYGGYVNFPGNIRRGRGGRVAVYTGIFTTGWPDDPNAWVGENARLFDADGLNALAGLTVDSAGNPVVVEGVDRPMPGTFYVVAYEPPPPPVLPVSEPTGLGLLGLALLGLRKRRG